MRQNKEFRQGFQLHFALMGAIAVVCVAALAVAFLGFD
jgi:hypothetical protein